MFLNDLPEYTGPYRVACRDVEYTKFLSNSVEDRKDRNSLSSAPLLVKLFYPAEFNPVEREKSRWAPYPPYNYFQGLLEYKKMTKFFSMPATYLFGSQTRTGAFSGDGSELLKTENPLPVAIFSHGLAGSRNGYSGICGEMASHGVVVCAIEHRDGTAVYSYGTAPPHCFEQQFAPETENAPGHLKFYQDRIKFRVKEVDQAYELLKDLNVGAICKDHLAPGNVNCPDFNSLQNKIFWNEGLSYFKGRLDIGQTMAVGHSFGGATVIEALSRPKTPFKAGIVFDPWMYPIAGSPVLKSLLVVNTQSFTNWSTNFERVKTLIQKSRSACVEVKNPSSLTKSFQLLTLPHAEHVHQSDIPCLFSRLSSHFLKSTVDPVLTLRRNAFAALSFIKTKLDKGLPELPVTIDVLNRSSPEYSSFIFHDV